MYGRKANQAAPNLPEAASCPPSSAPPLSHHHLLADSTPHISPIAKFDANKLPHRDSSTSVPAASPCAATAASPALKPVLAPIIPVRPAHQTRPAHRQALNPQPQLGRIRTHPHVSVDHTRTVRSRELLISRPPLTIRAITSSLCPRRVRCSHRVSVPQTRMPPSPDPLATLPSHAPAHHTPDSTSKVRSHPHVDPSPSIRNTLTVPSPPPLHNTLPLTASSFTQPS